MATGKMQWLIDEIKDGTEKYEIYNTGRHHGTIQKPTGSGKSSLFILDIIHRIAHKDPSRKLVVNISTPIIRLCEQQGNDLLSVIYGIKGIVKNIDTNKIAWFINNSGDASNYVTYFDMYHFSDINDYFLESKKNDVAIIISCHQSLNKAIRWMNKVIKDDSMIDVVTYVDEAHTISYKDVDQDEDSTKIDINTLCKKSDVYMVSATPKTDVIKLVNSYDLPDKDNDAPIILEKPSEAIRANKICGPKASIKQTEDGNIAADICIDYLNVLKTDGRIHKILVSCKDSEHLKHLRKQLIAAGYTVFSTCAREGMNTTSGQEDATFENTTHSFKDAIEFNNAIDKCNKDCFVLHIRQLISGIDVPSISDCIIQKNDTNNFNSYASVIQTIGRSLRLGDEREIDIEKREKKYAHTLFVTNEDNDTVYTDISFFLGAYYGNGNFKFYTMSTSMKYSNMGMGIVETGAPDDDKDIFATSNVINYWEKVNIDIKKYINNNVKPYFEDMQENGVKTYKGQLQHAVDIIERKYKMDIESVDLFKYIYDNNFRNDIIKIFENELNCKIA